MDLNLRESNLRNPNYDRHIPRKRFGQHFLHDQHVIQRIVSAINPKPTDHLIEIGPGQGALTLPVLKYNPHLEVIELDRDLIAHLEALHYPDLQIHCADVLKFDIATLKTDKRLLRIFGNLPYNISTPLIFHLLTFTQVISDMTFMLQKEVADRLAAIPAAEAYGRLSVMVQYHCQIELLFDVTPSAFIPPPKVQSSIIRLTPFQVYPLIAKNYAKFKDIVKHAFGQRRKTLRNSLRDIITHAQWEKSGIKPTLRAENLSIKDFVHLANSLE